MLASNRSIFIFVLPILLTYFASCSKEDSVSSVFENELESIDLISYTEPKKAIQKTDSLLSLKPNKKEKALLYFRKGEIYYLNDQFEEAYNNQLKALNLFTSINDLYNEGRSLITLSAACLRLNKLETAQKYALEALHIGKLIHDSRLEAKANNQLFQLHFKLKDYNKALNYIQHADTLFLNSKDTISVIAIKSNIASIYLQLKEYNKALQSYSEAMHLSQTRKDPKTLVSVLNNIGYTYLEVKDYESARKFFNGAITLNKNIKTLNAAPYKGLGYLYLLTNEQDSAKTNYQKALSIYKQTKNATEEIEIRDKLVSIAIMRGDYQEALNQQTIRDSVQLKVSNFEKDQLLKFANVNYEVKQQETELKLQKEINRRNRILLTSAIISLILLLVIAAFFLYVIRLRAINKASKLEQSLLRIQMNPHFIFNTLSAIQNITLEGDAIKSSNYIAKFSKLIRQNFDYVRKEEIILENEISMIKNYIETQQLRLNNKFSYTIDIDQSIDASLYKIPPMLLQPFVENAIEYGLKPIPKNGLLSVKINKDNDYLNFIIVDNGVGRITHLKQDKISEKLHATDIFIERLKSRKKGEEKSFIIEDLFQNNKPAGTKVTFKLRIS